MSPVADRQEIRAPVTYQEWLACLDMMKSGTEAGNAAFDAACMGSFAGSEVTRTALQRQIVETVNAVLNRSTRRFLKNLNDNIAFNELAQTELLFKRLKKDVNRVMFFTKLSFLPGEFRRELEESVREQMTRFWNDTVGFLCRQSVEFSNSELEDALFLIRRIKLFQ